jgi:hypothetical protein
MKMLNLILIIAVFLNISCSKSNTTSEPQPVNPQGDSKIGPFTVQFGQTGDFEHSFTANIAQAEGKIEYFFLPTELGTAELSAATINFSNCDTHK